MRAIRHKSWKMVLSTRDNWLHLYNLESDKGETIDLSGLNSLERQNLTEFFEAWNKEVKTTLGNYSFSTVTKQFHAQFQDTSILSLDYQF